MIPRQAERTDPELRPEVDLAERVEDGVAGGRGAADGVVLEGGGRGGRGGQFLEGGVEGADGSDASSGFETGGGPAVEGEAGSGRFFRVGYVPVLLLHIVCCCCCCYVVG